MKTTKTLVRPVVTGVATALCAAAANSALAADNEPAHDAIELASLESITVYATRRPSPAYLYPGQVSVVDHEQIADFNPSTISDIFQGMPGVRFDGGPRRTGEMPSIRGLAGAGVLVLFDGARQSFISGHDGRFFIDPALLKAVEVVRGPTSALYGSGALGGVIAFRTAEAADFLDPGETFGTRLKAGYQGVDDEWHSTGTAFLQGGDGRYDGIASLTYRSSGDIALGSGMTLPADNDVLSSLLKGTSRLSQGVALAVSWIRFTDDSVDPNNSQGANIAGPDNPEVRRDTRSDTVQARLSFAPPGSNWLDGSLVAYYTRNAVAESAVLSPRIASREVETLGFNLDNRSHFSVGDAATLTFVYGGEFYRDRQSGRDNQTADGTLGGVPNARARFHGLFAQAELELTGPFSLPGVVTFIPGLRWDRFENEAPQAFETEDEAVSPKIGLAYRPLPQLLFFGNWAEAFRAPTYNEVFADGTHFSIPDLSQMPPVFVSNLWAPNPDLTPETSRTWEVGSGLDLHDLAATDDQLTLKGSYWRSNVDNLIDVAVAIPAGCFGAPFPPCGTGPDFGNVTRNVNVGRARLDGIEIEARYDSRRIFARATYSAIDGTDRETGDFVGVLTPSRVFLDGGVKVPQAALRLGARLTLADEFSKVNDPAERRDSYEVVDLYAVWQPLKGPFKKVRLDVGIDNLTDADYAVVNAGVSEPGRNVKVAIGWRGTW